jgi:hypothetical protein
VTPALLDRPASLLADAATPAGHAGPAGGGRLTLEERLNAILHEARTTGSTECPVCHSGMTYTRAGAQCGGCRARLH